MRMQVVAIGVLALLVGAGCARQTSEEAPELSAELRGLVLDDVPTDIRSPAYIDFNGKVSLVGYSLEPERLAPPRSKVSLKLFWRAHSKLAPGYKLYTELVTPAGQRFDVGGGGPLRQGELGPSAWQPGKVYVDEVTLTVPEDIDAARFSIVVGLKAEPLAAVEAEAEMAAAGEPKEGVPTFGSVYLRVLSGLADAKHGGIVATLDTGVTPGAKRARAARDEKRGGAKRPLPGKQPASAKPRDPAARPAPSPSQK
jgi:hypothetical protein